MKQGTNESRVIGSLVVGVRHSIVQNDYLTLLVSYLQNLAFVSRKVYTKPRNIETRSSDQGGGKPTPQYYDRHANLLV